MKTRVITTLCAGFVLGLASVAHAQLLAGSPEDKAFTKIEHEGDQDSKIALLLDFEKQFPQSKALSDVYRMLEECYTQKKDTGKVIEVAERAIKHDPNDVDALLKVSYNLGIQKQQLDKAVAYAQRAMDAIAKMKSGPPPQFSDAQQWQSQLASMEQSAQQILDYVKRLK